MHAIVESRLDRLAELCATHHVLRLELFGSAAMVEGEGAHIGDVDFLVEFAPCSPEEHSGRYFGLLKELETLFGGRVDLVETKAMKNPYFIRRVNESRKLVYAAA